MTPVEKRVPQNPQRRKGAHTEAKRGKRNGKVAEQFERSTLRHR